ncbi:hypothetical protein RND81_01G004200 [Saponaria officinalis]|uniref:Rhodanese domain-containing protein n=1 Tax=Saponaria officinalis TaxID=3572 RepID=A0AAW1N856_SAPOF
MSLYPLHYRNSSMVSIFISNLLPICCLLQFYVLLSFAFCTSTSADPAIVTYSNHDSEIKLQSKTELGYYSVIIEISSISVRFELTRVSGTIQITHIGYSIGYQFGYFRSVFRVRIYFARYISDTNHGPNEKEALNAPKSVPVSTAIQLIRDGYAFLDVRTPEEFEDGHPKGAINIAYMSQTESGMLKNPQFEQQVLSSFQKDDQIIIGCRSGKRSLMAATDLASVGFRNIVDLAGGYIAWTRNGLPVHKPE